MSDAAWDAVASACADCSQKKKLKEQIAKLEDEVIRWKYGCSRCIHVTEDCKKENSPNNPCERYETANEINKCPYCNGPWHGTHLNGTTCPKKVE